MFELSFFSRYHHEAPPRRPTLKFKLDSTLVKLEHIAIFSSWIKKKDSSYNRKRNIPYKFNLLYRASRDGNSAASFHEKCPQISGTFPTVAVIDYYIPSIIQISWKISGIKSAQSL